MAHIGGSDQEEPLRLSGAGQWRPSRRAGGINAPLGAPERRLPVVSLVEVYYSPTWLAGHREHDVSLSGSGPCRTQLCSLDHGSLPRTHRRFGASAASGARTSLERLATLPNSCGT